MTSVEEILEKLERKADPKQLEGMSRYGINVDKRLGVKVPEMRKIAKETGKDHQLALGLWRTGIAEARIVASMIDVPAEVTEEQMEEWVADFNSWDVCDQVCMNLFEKTPFAWEKIHEWSLREQEFVKRATYALIAILAWHDKESPDEKFIELMPVIKSGSTDERNMVKKGVSWSLRNIGKRSPHLIEIALGIAEQLAQMDSKAARWIAADARRDLTSETTKRRLSKMVANT